jgi:hypothetical protein
MRRIILGLSLLAMVASASFAVSTNDGDKDKKCKKSCSKEEKKACSKEGDKKSCCKKEKKSCCKTGGAKADSSATK